MMYPTPNYVRKTVQLMVWLTILAWATQLLFAKWAHGEELPAAQFAEVPVELGGSEKFVPGGERFSGGATLELKGEVTLIGEEVKLKQVCRWSDGGKGAFEPIADLVLFRLSRQSPYRTLTVREMRDTLHDAGVNLAIVRLAGATTCTVSRTDVKFYERSALDQWIAAKDAGGVKPGLLETPATQPTKAVVVAAGKPQTASVEANKP